MEGNGNEYKIGLTDTINVSNSNIENIDIGLIENKIFDLKLSKYISKVTVKSTQGTEVTKLENSRLAKVDVKSKYIDGTNIEIEYKIVVTNEGEVSGYAKKIIDYLPQELQFSQSSNKNWKQQGQNLIYTGLERVKIEAGESKTITLLLTKKLDKNSLGTITNTAEIQDSYNSDGIEDQDSTPGNKKKGEDDMSSASIIISVATGRVVTYCLTTILTIIVLVIGVYVIKKKVLDTK